MLAMGCAGSASLGSPEPPASQHGQSRAEQSGKQKAPTEEVVNTHDMNSEYLASERRDVFPSDDPQAAGTGQWSKHKAGQVVPEVIYKCVSVCACGCSRVYYALMTVLCARRE